MACLDINPLIRDAVASQEILDLVGEWRPSVPDHADPLEWWIERGLPVVKQVVEHGVKILVGWIPRLHKVVIELDLVDGAYRRFRIRIRCEKGTLGLGKYRHPPLEELHT